MRMVCFAGYTLSKKNAGLASILWCCYQLHRDEGNIEKMNQCEFYLKELGIDVKLLDKKNNYYGKK